MTIEEKTRDYQLTILHYNSLSAGEKKDILMKPGEETLIPSDETGKEISLGITLNSLRFIRKIYEPNEIIAQLKIISKNTTDSRPGLSSLRTMFFKKPVSFQFKHLINYNKDVKDSDVPENVEEYDFKFTNLYVHEVIPEYKSDTTNNASVFVTLKIYSLDKLMTLDKYSQAYLGRKFRDEILQSVGRFKLGYEYKKNSSLRTDTSQIVEFNNEKKELTQDNKSVNEEIYKLQHLAYGTRVYTADSKNYRVQNEFIQPYLVQYNESFYDFLVRVANRCGEFLFFDDGKLTIGLKLTTNESKEVSPSDINIINKVNNINLTNLTGYNSLTFENISGGVLSVVDYTRDSMKEPVTAFGTSKMSNYPKIERKSYGKKIYKFTGEEREVTFPNNTNLLSNGKFSTEDVEFTGVIDFTKPTLLSPPIEVSKSASIPASVAISGTTFDNNGIELTVTDKEGTKSGSSLILEKEKEEIKGGYIALVSQSSVTIKTEYPIENIEINFHSGSKGKIKCENVSYDASNNKIGVSKEVKELTLEIEVDSENNPVLVDALTIITKKKGEVTDDTPDTYFYNSELAHDEFFMPLYREGFGTTNPTESFVDVNYGNTDRLATHIVGDFLQMSSLADYLASHAIELAKQGIEGAVYKNERNDRGTKRLINDYRPTYNYSSGTITEKPDYVVPFSENELKRWTTLEYYSDIKIFEEKQQRMMASLEYDHNLKALRLGDVFTLAEDNDLPYITCEIEITIGEETNAKGDKEYVARQRIKGIPMYNTGTGWRAYPPVIEGDVIRKSGPQTAFVVDSADPKRQNRVRIKYPWQTSSKNIPSENIYTKESDKEIWESYNAIREEAASPWIRMATPSATKDAGIYFEAEPGDEVIVNFENDNVERPYVMGALYSKDLTAPVMKGRRAIVSKFGHMIRFNDPSTGAGEIADSKGLQRIMADIFPLIDTISLWKKDDLFSRIGNNENIDRMTGGIDITDAFGLYSISMSSDQRTVKIKSPFGDVGINAFSGISITAPNGNIKIAGKNIDIVASNKVNIVSGTNLSEGSLSKTTLVGGFTTAQDAKDTIMDYFSEYYPINLELIRTVVEVAVRPIEGTLTLKSHGFVKMEAGSGDAHIPRSNYCNWYLKYEDKNAMLLQLNYNIKKTIALIDITQKILDDYTNTLKKSAQQFRKLFDNFFENYGPYIRNMNIEKDLLDKLYANQPVNINMGEISNIAVLSAHLYPNQNDPAGQPLLIANDDPWFDKANAKFNEIYNTLHGDSGLLALSNFNYFDKYFTNKLKKKYTNQVINELQNSFRESFDFNNTGIYIFESARKFDSSNGAQPLVNDLQNDTLNLRSIGGDNWNIQKKYLVRLITLFFLRKLNAAYKITVNQFFPNNSREVIGQWASEIQKLTLTTTLTTGERSKWSDFLVGVFGDFATEIGHQVWQEGAGVKGKILLSDEADSTAFLQHDATNHTLNFSSTDNDMDAFPTEDVNKMLRKMESKLKGKLSSL